ncbi:hypothetical protein RHS01_05872 [Rhizoctonia solani]|uniref:Uncharacterized protein n=1 Tax=Rhizoctonia solani TaxID=456999 RepID=A0A8H7M4V4_9AGAM|nr:hypothetical protein RHS01_05872 [Rhizoctonia solani]
MGYTKEISGILQAESITHPPNTSNTQPDPLKELSLDSSDALIPFSDHDDKNQSNESSQTGTNVQGLGNCHINIPREIILDPISLENMTSLIVSLRQILSRCTLQGDRVLGRGAHTAHRSLICCSMVDVSRARVIIDLLNGTNAQKYLGWIFRFCRRITDISTSDDLGANLDLEGRFDGIYDLISIGSMLSGTATAYSLLRRCTPVFLRLAAAEPRIWADDSSISIANTFRSSRYELAQFIINDGIFAIALGTHPLLRYDTSVLWAAKPPGVYLEWIYGFPIEIFILLININARRTGCIVGGATGSTKICSEIEARLKNWNSTVDHTEAPGTIIARLAGAGGVNSADPRIEAAVQQVVRLGSIIEPGSSFELHLLLPSLIAGAAARREKHRSALRSKVASGLLRKVNPQVLPVRGLDFIPVLDHLWHNEGSGGSAVTWDDYVHSRYTVLPVEKRPSYD